MAIADPGFVRKLPIQVTERYSADPVRAGANAVSDHIRAAVEGHLEHDGVLYGLIDHSAEEQTSDLDKNRHRVDQVCAALLSVRQCETLVHLTIVDLIGKHRPLSGTQLVGLERLRALVATFETRYLKLFETAYEFVFEALGVINDFHNEDTGEWRVREHEQILKDWKAELVRRVTDQLGWPAIRTGSPEAHHWSPTFVEGVGRIARWLVPAARGTQESRYAKAAGGDLVRNESTGRDKPTLREGFKRHPRSYPEL